VKPPKAPSSSGSRVAPICVVSIGKL